MVVEPARPLRETWMRAEVVMKAVATEEIATRTAENAPTPSEVMYQRALTMISCDRTAYTQTGF